MPPRLYLEDAPQSYEELLWGALTTPESEMPRTAQAPYAPIPSQDYLWNAISEGYQASPYLPPYPGATTAQTPRQAPQTLSSQEPLSWGDIGQAMTHAGQWNAALMARDALGLFGIHRRDGPSLAAPQDPQDWASQQPVPLPGEMPMEAAQRLARAQGVGTLAGMRRRLAPTQEESAMELLAPAQPQRPPLAGEVVAPGALDPYGLLSLDPTDWLAGGVAGPLQRGLGAAGRYTLAGARQLGEAAPEALARFATEPFIPTGVGRLGLPTGAPAETFGAPAMVGRPTRGGGVSGGGPLVNYGIGPFRDVYPGTEKPPLPSWVDEAILYGPEGQQVTGAGALPEARQRALVVAQPGGQGTMTLKDWRAKTAVGRAYEAQYAAEREERLAGLLQEGYPAALQQLREQAVAENWSKTRLAQEVSALKRENVTAAYQAALQKTPPYIERNPIYLRDLPQLPPESP